MQVGAYSANVDWGVSSLWFSCISIKAQETMPWTEVKEGTKQGTRLLCKQKHTAYFKGELRAVRRLLACRKSHYLQ